MEQLARPAPQEIRQDVDLAHRSRRQRRPQADAGSRAADAVFSPDGSKIAFLRAEERGYRYVKGGKAHAGVETTSDLYVMPAAGGASTRLTDAPGAELEPAWDPSGSRIAFARLSTAKTEAAFLGIGDSLIEVNADGSCETPVLSRPGSALLSPVWQPGPGRGAAPIAC